MTSSKTTKEIDVVLLRNSLRLLHQIQKERGYSLYCYADRKTFEKAMFKARSLSDTSAKYMKETDRHTIERSLFKIRNLIDSRDSSDDKHLFHRIFLCYNTLASRIVHDYINPHVPGKFDKSFVRKRNLRSLSFDFNTELGKKFSIDHSDRSIDSDASPKLPLHEDIVASDSDEQSLLTLMRIFVQLKESAGIERAVLSSLLLFQNHRKDSLRNLQTDLILHVENQRSLVSQLEQLPPGQHRDFVLQLAELSPRLKELQRVILNDFETLPELNFDAESIWNLLTDYIDKLHSVELLIVEDLELSLPHKSTSSENEFRYHTSPASQEEYQNNFDFAQFLGQASSLLAKASPTKIEQLVSELQSMNAEVAKSRLLKALNKELGNEISPSDNCPSEKSGDSVQLDTPLANNEKRELTSSVNGKSRKLSKEWEISIYEIKFSKRIGQGASATTYKATWLRQEVAVKVASITEFGLEGWRREVGALQRLHHPNVIRLLGSVEHENPLTYCLVLEYCNAGDLNTALKYPTHKNFFFHCAESIANAMTYLHSRHIIHRDLKPSNVLCHGNIASGNFTIKVTDFGVAATDFRTTVESEGGSLVNKVISRGNLTGGTGTYRWMAPEVIRFEPYSLMADVYSFAVMCWQFVSHDEPFMDIDATEAAKVVAIGKGRPPIPVNTPKSIADLIKINWSDNPSERWNFAKIGETLEEIKASMTYEEKKWLEEPYGHPIYIYDDHGVVNENASTEKKQRFPTKPKKKEGSICPKLRRWINTRKVKVLK